MTNLVSVFLYKSKNSYVNIAILLLVAILSSYVVAQLYSSILFKNICKAINIRRTVNPYIWNDIEDKSQTLWVRIGFKELDLKYMGILCCVEDFQRTPIIVLTRYSKCRYSEDENGESAFDFTNKPEQRVVIDTSKADFIELIYDKSSEVIKEIK